MLVTLVTLFYSLTSLLKPCTKKQICLFLLGILNFFRSREPRKRHEAQAMRRRSMTSNKALRQRAKPSITHTLC